MPSLLSALAINMNINTDVNTVSAIIHAPDPGVKLPDHLCKNQRTAEPEPPAGASQVKIPSVDSQPCSGGSRYLQLLTSGLKKWEKQQ